TATLTWWRATSEWIQFFKDAGIPASLAVNYAVSFVDNRIQKNMLMDLSKDIMMDLGITVIGDIIAILKHAKQVYRQDMCKMATEAISSGQTSVKAELRRTANTPATRMIANALSHESPPATPVRRSDNRLSVTVSNVQQADEGNSEPAVKRRRVTAEMEGKYIINMPKGTTARTRLILAQQAEKGLKRTSVFARLGAESKVDTSTTNNKPTGVFSRLDLTREEDPTKAPNVLINGDDSDGEESVLQYAGVLKKASPVPKKEPVVSKPTSLRRLGGKFKLPSSDTPTSSTVNGLPPAKISVLQRLGTHPGAAAPPTDEQDNRVTSTKPKAQERLIIASSKVSSSTGAGAVGDGHSAQMDARAVSVFKRLGNKKPNRLFYMCF
uniref:Chromosome 19 open reading frame 47 n=1 Tax=Neogobius melanostomus TaxID=47308 RepID=A0A8C6SE89_9GOBI